ncbi:MAG: nuclear transport factor 2 family protein [Bryobacterales bacterium]|nr:nuclear transport factor 2 family protein [Bryobacterales bacterium]
MKKFVILAMAAGLLAAPTWAQGQKKAGRMASAAAKAQEDTWVAAVRANDLAALDKLLADNLIYTHSTGIVETKAQYLEKLKSGDQKYANIEYSDVKTFHLGRAQVVSATVRMTGATKGVPFDNRLKMLHVWAVQPDGSMRLVAHQTTRLQ